MIDLKAWPAPRLGRLAGLPCTLLSRDPSRRAGQAPAIGRRRLVGYDTLVGASCDCDRTMQAPA